MKRLVLVSAAILALVAAPVMVDAQTKPWAMTHIGTPMDGLPSLGSIIVGVSVFDGAAWTTIDGVAFQMAACSTE